MAQSSLKRWFTQVPSSQHRPPVNDHIAAVQALVQGRPERVLADQFHDGRVAEPLPGYRGSRPVIGAPVEGELNAAERVERVEDEDLGSLGAVQGVAEQDVVRPAGRRVCGTRIPGDVEDVGDVGEGREGVGDELEPAAAEAGREGRVCGARTPGDAGDVGEGRDGHDDALVVGVVEPAAGDAGRGGLGPGRERERAAGDPVASRGVAEDAGGAQVDGEPLAERRGAAVAPTPLLDHPVRSGALHHHGGGSSGCWNGRGDWRRGDQRARSQQVGVWLLGFCAPSGFCSAKKCFTGVWVW